VGEGEKCEGDRRKGLRWGKLTQGDEGEAGVAIFEKTKGINSSEVP
jgi:hypothetical protein